MATFSITSHQRLSTCHEDLQVVCQEAILIYDFRVIQGRRTREQHAEYLHAGTTKIAYEDSKHSHNPSLAVDIAPFPIDWEDTGRFKLLAGIILGIAHTKKIKLRWGGDWNMNGNMKDQKFFDLPHFEKVLI